MVPVCLAMIAVVGATAATAPQGCRIGRSCSDDNSLLQKASAAAKEFQHHSATSNAERKTERKNASASPFVFYSIGAGHEMEADVDAVLDTWAAQVDPEQVHFVGAPRPADDGRARLASWDEAALCSDSHAGGACKDREGLVEGYKRGADWVVLLGLDNYVLTGNLEKELAKMNPNEPQVLGILGCGSCSGGGLCGGGGQIFSKMALKRMLENGEKQFRREASAAAQKQLSTGSMMYGDVANCNVATNHGVPLYNFAGLHGWPESDEDLTDAIQREFPAALTFHYIRDPAEMQKVHEIVRHAQLSKSTSGKSAVIMTHAEEHARKASGLAEWYRKVALHVVEEEKARRAVKKM